MAFNRKVKVQLWLIVAAMIFGIWLLFRLIAWGQCSWYGYQTQRDTRYAAFIGCMVKVHDGWIPRAEIRTLND
jgi:hypothetical protein